MACWLVYPLACCILISKDILRQIVIPVETAYRVLRDCPELILLFSEPIDHCRTGIESASRVTYCSVILIVCYLQNLAAAHRSVNARTGTTNPFHDP